MAAVLMRVKPVHPKRDRCFFCASDQEIATAMSKGVVRTVLARVFRQHPTIHWQGVTCPFEEA
jgi:hypothetical protein